MVYHGTFLYVQGRTIGAHYVGCHGLIFGWNSFSRYEKDHYRMVQGIAKMRLGLHCLAIHTGRYNGIVREDRVCRLCQTLGYRDDTTGSIPVEDLVHFMLDCRVLHPVRDNFPLFFKPTSLPGQSKDSHVKFILNHSDHVQVVRCISALKKRRESCLQLLDDGREGEIMPEGYLPFDYNLWRIMGHDTD